MATNHLGFCSECCGIYELGKDEAGKSVKLLRNGKAYIDLAAEHTLSSPDTAFRIVNGAYEKMLIELAIDGYFHIVELRRKKKTKTKIVYEYCADHNNDWGEICYTPGDDDYEVTRYVYADKKGGFFFAAGDWIAWQSAKEKFRKQSSFRLQKYSYKTQKTPSETQKICNRAGLCCANRHIRFAVWFCLK